MADHQDEMVTPLPVVPEERWLTWYLRLLASFFFISGVLRWFTILGVPGWGDFDDLETHQQVLVGYCAVIALVASVGLWIQASWGTVIWLIAALSEIVAFTAFRDVFGGNLPLVVFHFITLIAYLVLAWRVARLREE